MPGFEVMTGAPTATIETVTVVRPIKVIACLCGFICTILLIAAVASSEWLSADGYRAGLWVECIRNSTTNITFCDHNPKKAWIEACGALMIIGLLLCVTSTIVTVVALCMENHELKYKLYKIAMYLFFLVLVCILISAIVFPSMFHQDWTKTGRPHWEFSWAYGFVWGAAVFSAGAAFMLLCDKETDEIYYREKINYPSETSLEAR